MGIFDLYTFFKHYKIHPTREPIEGCTIAIDMNLFVWKHSTQFMRMDIEKTEKETLIAEHIDGLLKRFTKSKIYLCWDGFERDVDKVNRGKSPVRMYKIREKLSSYTHYVSDSEGEGLACQMGADYVLSNDSDCALYLHNIAKKAFDTLDETFSQIIKTRRSEIFNKSMCKCDEIKTTQEMSKKVLRIDPSICKCHTDDVRKKYYLSKMPKACMCQSSPCKCDLTEYVDDFISMKGMPCNCVTEEHLSKFAKVCDCENLVSLYKVFENEIQKTRSKKENEYVIKVLHSILPNGIPVSISEANGIVSAEILYSHIKYWDIGIPEMSSTGGAFGMELGMRKDGYECLTVYSVKDIIQHFPVRDSRKPENLLLYAATLLGTDYSESINSVNVAISKVLNFDVTMSNSQIQRPLRLVTSKFSRTFAKNVVMPVQKENTTSSDEDYLFFISTL